MLTRLYFLFPEKPQVVQAAKELKTAGVKPGRMHCIARKGVDLTSLPVASHRQKQDFSAVIERNLWNLNLVVFFAAMLFFVYAIVQGSWLLGISCLLIMTTTLYLGMYFVSHVPHMHLDQFQGALSHREILLMVDVPRWYMTRVETVIKEHHPEASLDGVGWTVEAFGV